MSITLTRQELYDRVWAEPIDRLCKEFVLSDVGLGKACRRHDIPVPPTGYWQQKAAGHKGRQPPLPLGRALLPARKPSHSLASAIQPPAGDEQLAAESASPVHPLIAWEHQTEHAIAVPEDVRVVHRQIRATREYRAAQKRGEIKYGENKLPNLNVRVSNAALPRALILPYEWITESRSHRRFMVPAEIVNAHGVIARLQTAE